MGFGLGFNFGFGASRGSGGSGAGASTFEDDFAGSADDPALNSTKWTQTARSSASNVNTTVAGHMYSVRHGSGGGQAGNFIGYSANIVETDGTGNGTTFVLTGARLGVSSDLNRISLLCRHTTKGQTDQDGTGVATGYMLRFDGAGVAVLRAVGAGYGEFTSSVLSSDFTTAKEITVTVTTLSDRVRFVVKLDGVTEATLDDTNASRITAKGYSGISLWSTHSSGSASARVDAFAISI